MSRALVRNTWLRPRPYLLYLKPTARCDLRCKICQRWQEPARTSEELSTAELRAVLALFRKLGAAIMVAWGGEPLLRQDMGDIFQAAKELGYRTSMCTNGRQLAQRVDHVMPWLDTLLCSLDGYGQTHDRARGRDGLFDQVVAGLKLARRHTDTRIKIWAALNRQNLADIEPLAELARELGIWIEYFPIARVPGYNDALVLETSELRDAFERVLALQRAGYPVWNRRDVLVKMRDDVPFRCNFGRIALQVDHRGWVHSCEDPDGSPLHTWGRWDVVDWPELFRSPRFAAAQDVLSRCGKCRLPCVVELGDSLAAAYAGMFWQSLTRSD